MDCLQGVGIGLRSTHFQELLASSGGADWLEVLADNYLSDGGQPRHFLRQFAEHNDLSFHCVGLSLGSADAPDRDYLSRLKALIDELQPKLVSDHLCWTSVHGQYSHDLLPMPYTEANARFLADKILWVQDYLGRRILVENVSSYISYEQDSLAEWDFMAEVLSRADCDLLCDVNNIYVSAVNHGFDPLRYLEALPASRVKEIHLAGYEDCGTHLLDTHGAPVTDPVWSLYRQALERFGSVPTLIEWDNDIPELPVLLAEAQKARTLLERSAHAA